MGAAIFALLGAGCSTSLIARGRTLGHSYRGVPDNDFSVTPDPTKQSNSVEVSNADESAATPGGGPAGLPVEPVWTTGPEVRRVNVFGEIDGMKRALTTTTGDAGFQQHTYTDEGGDSNVTVDPTGKWLAFASTRHSERTDVYLQRVDGTSVMQLTSDAADDNYPSFSPDGKMVAFASTRAGSWQIYMMDTDGRDVVQVTNGNMQAVHPSFSPEGQRIVYCALGSRSNQWELWTADLRTNEKRMIGYGLFPVWSPDKTVDRIAYQRARQRGGRWFSLWTLDLIENEGRRMTEVVGSTNAAVVSPAWSPDGKRLVFGTVTDSGKSNAQAAGAAPKAKTSRGWGQQDIWTVNADGSNRQRLTDGNGTNLSPYWSADGRIYFVSNRGGSDCIWSVKGDSGRLNDVAGATAKGRSAPPHPPGVPDPGATEVFVDPLDAGR